MWCVEIGAQRIEIIVIVHVMMRFYIKYLTYIYIYIRLFFMYITLIHSEQNLEACALRLSRKFLQRLQITKDAKKVMSFSIF